MHLFHKWRVTRIFKTMIGYTLIVYNCSKCGKEKEKLYCPNMDCKKPNACPNNESKISLSDEDKKKMEESRPFCNQHSIGGDKTGDCVCEEKSEQAKFSKMFNGYCDRWQPILGLQN